MSYVTYSVEVDRESAVFSIIIDYLIDAYNDPETGESFGDTSWTATIRNPDGGPVYGNSGYSGESGWVPLEFGIGEDEGVARFELEFRAASTFSADEVEASWTVFVAGLAATNLSIAGTDTDDIIVASDTPDVITSGGGDDWVLAAGGADRIDGGAGADKLDGGAGDDRLIGGLGGDTYFVDSARDVVVENPGEGDDVVYAFVDYTVSAEVERLVLVGAAVRGTGTVGSQRIEGNALDNILSGLSGDDHLRGGLGNDQLLGGLGADWLDGDAGADRMGGGQGDDHYGVNDAGDLVVEGAGGGIDTVAVTGIERYALTGNVENLERYGRGDFVGVGNALNNRMIGGVDGDRLAGGLGDDLLEGRDGNDWLVGGEGRDRLFGGEGEDTADYSGSTAAVQVSLRTGSGLGGTAERDILRGIEHLLGSAFDDQLIGSALANTLTGGAGNDDIQGAAGDDTILGGAGEDRLDGGLGRDTLSYAGSARGAVQIDLSTGVASGGDAAGDLITGFENIRGGSGADTLTGDGGDNVIAGGFGADQLSGGGGRDTLDYSTSVGAVRVDLALLTAAGSEAQGDTIAGFESVLGGAGNDRLNGDAGANALSGGDGDDVIYGRDGDDIINGGLGADTLGGGLGSDTISYAGLADTVIVDLATQTTYSGAAAGDVLYSFENAWGGERGDGLYGDDGDNRLWGRGGFDFLDGRGGNDRLTGGTEGDVFIFGSGYGHDVIVDYQDGDQLFFTLAEGGATYEQMIGYARSTGANGEHTLFDLGDSTLLLLNVAKDSLNAGDFYQEYVEPEFIV